MRLLARCLVPLEAAAGLYLLYALARFVRLSLHWPLVGDASLMHYCVFLLQHGFAPYRQIIDINLPGTYLVEWIVIRLFGYGALPWRVFDLLLLLFIAAMTWLLLRPRASGKEESSPRGTRWFAALWVTGVFVLLHGRDGIAQLGQRDLLVTALLSAAFVLLFEAYRSTLRSGRHAATQIAGFSLALGTASTVKPIALLLLPLLLALFAYALHRHSRQVDPDFRRRPAWHWTFGVAAAAGALIPAVAVLNFLLKQHAISDFWQITSALVPLHSSLFRLSMPRLLLGSISSVMLPLFLLGLPAVIARRPWRSFEGAALLIGIGFGVFSFCVQGRGYPYHRYPLHFFLLLLFARELVDALNAAATPVLLRTCAGLSLLFGVAVIVPRSLDEIAHFTPTVDTFDAALSSALAQPALLRGQPVGGNIQCLDMAGGCLTTLLRHRLPQSTGFLYDCYAFLPVAPAFIDEQQLYRAAWLASLTAHPPAVMVATSDECGPVDNRYTKLTRWPAFAALLKNRYVLSSEWTPTVPQRWSGRPVLPYGFRIYTLR